MLRCDNIIDTSIGSILREYYEADDAETAAQNRHTEKLNARARKELRDMGEPVDGDDEEEEEDDEIEEDENKDPFDLISLSSSQQSLDDENAPPDLSSAELLVRASWCIDGSAASLARSSSARLGPGAHWLAAPHLPLVNTQERDMDDIQPVEFLHNASGIEIRCKGRAEAVIESVTIFADQSAPSDEDDGGGGDGDNNEESSGSAAAFQRQQERNAQNSSLRRRSAEGKRKRAALMQQQQRRQHSFGMPAMMMRAKVLEGPQRFDSAAAAAAPALAVCTLGSAAHSGAGTLFTGEQQRVRLTCPKSSDLVIGFLPLDLLGSASSQQQQHLTPATTAKRFTCVIKGIVRLYKAWSSDLRAAIGAPSLMLRSSATRQHPACINDDGTFPPTRMYCRGGSSSNGDVANNNAVAAAASTSAAGQQKKQELVAATHNVQRIPLHCQTLRCLPILYTSTCSGSLGAPPPARPPLTADQLRQQQRRLELPPLPQQSLSRQAAAAATAAAGGGGPPTPSRKQAGAAATPTTGHRRSSNLVPCFVLDASCTNKRTKEPQTTLILPAEERRRQREERQRTGIDPQSAAAWANLLAAPGGEIFQRRYTPASSSRAVNVRRFPHRNADILGIIPFGAVATATAMVHDPKNNEWYVEWAPELNGGGGGGGGGGGFSRVRGSLGPFLVQLWPGKETTILDPPRFFGVSEQFGKTVRVRSAPCLKTGVVVAPDVQTNEARAALALHSGPDDEFGDSTFVEWADGSGYSRKSGKRFAILEWENESRRILEKSRERQERINIKAAQKLQRQEENALDDADGDDGDVSSDSVTSSSVSSAEEELPEYPDSQIEDRIFLVELPQIRSAIAALAKKS